MTTLKLARTKHIPMVAYVPGKPSWSVLKNPEKYVSAATHDDDSRPFRARMEAYKRMMQPVVK